MGGGNPKKKMALTFEGGNSRKEKMRNDERVATDAYNKLSPDSAGEKQLSLLRGEGPKCVGHSILERRGLAQNMGGMGARRI